MFDNVSKFLDELVIGESSRWHQGKLWLANWGTQEVITVNTPGTKEVICKVPTTIPYSIDWIDNRLLIICGSERQLLIKDPSQDSLSLYANLQNYSTPFNEIVVDGKNNIYVNNVGFDLVAGEKPKNGFVVLITPEGKISKVGDDLLFPNGMAITSGNTTLIVAESYGMKLTAFNIENDGSLSKKRIWAQIENYHPDGICIDSENAVWFADVPNKCCVRVKEGGDILEKVNIDRGCFACMLGGENKKTLFMVASEWKGTTKIDNKLTGYR